MGGRRTWYIPSAPDRNGCLRLACDLHFQQQENLQCLHFLEIAVSGQRVRHISSSRRTCYICVALESLTLRLLSIAFISHYSPLFSRLTVFMLHVALSDQPFIARFGISTKVMCLQHCLVVTWLVPRESAAVLAHILCTPYNPAPVSFHSKPCKQGVSVLSCNVTPALLAE